MATRIPSRLHASKRALLLAPLLLIAHPAVAELSKAECRTGDWQKIGVSDGRAGVEPHAITLHTTRCEGFGFAADASAYLAGWNEGIAQHCTQENGYELGAQGQRYRNPCPVPLNAEFSDGFQTGRQVHLAEAEIAELEAMVLELSEELTRITQEQQETETHLVLGDATATERYRWLEETKFLARERAQAEGELNALDLEIESRKEHLELLRTSLAYSN
ncbi:MAG: DUF2799 domain-containing protein [Gammaproteobacteria bacterium]|nr:DUF2799 domain-containing protein [Gammaproteobacteria bacterium]